ncbi:MAG: hypothetical protein A3F84_01595 [Candidatus Handelsmanbacteria bacterium RIFCSPLOWO2_12_FULL_64_10]|uniref:Uncharacterized protein n=1 Tax=Handelsmanbacteria sp. (strain RIFCSPLOWO2_12_FULL_64_10) TaxID=1817868 RepID=A0A1F6D219_HANXR|nr:MAG: hypothetical protein A3F84_01595 [Candidatus Handelsmanbacteria bacterium RIFCSPLOWO2_12_FULL_64_10]
MCSSQSSGRGITKLFTETLYKFEVFLDCLIDFFFMIIVIRDSSVDLSQTDSRMCVADLIRRPAQPVIFEGNMLDFETRPGNSGLSTTDAFILNDVILSSKLRRHGSSS